MAKTTVLSWDETDRKDKKVMDSNKEIKSASQSDTREWILAECAKDKHTSFIQKFLHSRKKQRTREDASFSLEIVSWLLGILLSPSTGGSIDE
jgi:hypothetical protein